MPCFWAGLALDSRRYVLVVLPPLETCWEKFFGDMSLWTGKVRRFVALGPDSMK